MRNLTKIELDTLRWVRDSIGVELRTYKRRKTFQKLTDLGLIKEWTLGISSHLGRSKIYYHYTLTSGGEMVLSSYDGPRRVVSKG